MSSDVLRCKWLIPAKPQKQLPRMIFEAAVSWAGKAGKSNFWSLARTTVKGAPRDAGVRTDECVDLIKTFTRWRFSHLFIGRDHAQLERMRQLGMKAEDEYKLSAMRDYINKLAAARQASVSFLFPFCFLCDPPRCRSSLVLPFPALRLVSRTRRQRTFFPAQTPHYKTSAWSLRRSFSRFDRNLKFSMSRGRDSRLSHHQNSREPDSWGDVLRRPPEEGEVTCQDLQSLQPASGLARIEASVPDNSRRIFVGDLRSAAPADRLPLYRVCKRTRPSRERAIPALHIEQEEQTQSDSDPRSTWRRDPTSI